MAKDLFNRYIWLVDTIYRAGKITFEEINKRWVRTEMSGHEEIPLRTFHNHRKAIEELFDINIECNRKGGYYYYIENAEDIKQDKMRSWLLDAFAVNHFISESRQLKHRIMPEEIPSGQEHLMAIVEAMRGSRRLKMSYQSFLRDEPYECTVEPYFVKVFKQRWYVLGYSLRHEEIRTFALDRIGHLCTTDEKFTFPADFDAQSYLSHYFGVIADDTDIECVSLKVYGNQVKYIRALPLHHSQKEIIHTPDYSVFEYMLAPTYDFRQEILSHGADVEILMPEWLRDELAVVIREMAQRYNHSS